MTACVVLAVLINSALAPWRFTSGLLLGGALSILNYRWLHSSVAAMLSAKTPRAQASRYFLRYLVIGLAIFAAYELQLVSLAATLAGLCSFVPALMFEALREFYFVIIGREESL